ncbi:MAG: hypothetical protein ACO1Q7_19130 [Gemmatimonas sp.]
MIPSKDDAQASWAYTHSNRQRFVVSQAEAEADKAWRQLLIEHMPHHALDHKERNRIVDQLASLENEIYRSLSERSVRADRSEVHAGTEVDDMISPLSVLEMDRDDVDREWSGIDTRILSTDADGRRLLARQARLMEQAFVLLRLDRYANAPVNRGVMNLFRAWSSSRAFDVLLDRSRAVFSKPFLAFYRYYIRGLPRIDERPVPHPWDRDVAKAQRAAAEEPPIRLFAGTLKMSSSFANEAGPGIYLDSGIIESERDEHAQLSASQKDEQVKAKDELPNA